MHCELWHKLHQRMYLAGIRREGAEADRLAYEILKHEQRCAVCSGIYSPAVPLVDELFGAHVIVKETE